MAKWIIPIAAGCALAYYALWGQQSPSSDRALLEVAQASSCSHDGQTYDVGDSVCIEGKEYQCTVDGFVATGSGC